MSGARQTAAASREEGAVLLLVLWVIALISVVILSWGQEWRTELQLSANFRQAHQCRRLAEAGIYYALGKMVEAKAAELTLATGGGAFGTPGAYSQPMAAVGWRADQSPHILELPGGQAEIRVADEGGKVGLNLANEMVLKNLFQVLGYGEAAVRIMTDSIIDWRSKGELPRPYGAKSDYYMGLNPPYPAREAKFEIVEELNWVRGFENDPNPGRLSDFLTAHGVGQNVNVNTAPLEVLLALGLPPDLARNVVLRRQAGPVRQQDLPSLTGDPRLGPIMQYLGFQSSPFFTIKSTGMIHYQGRPIRHTIKVLVRLDINQETPWEIIAWLDDYPG